MHGIEWLNSLLPGDARHELLTCCASRRWADEVTAARPFADETALLWAVDNAFASLGWPDIEEGLSAHPRIGDRPKGLDRESSWSRSEQSGVIDAERAVAHGLHEGNQEYEERFGHVFLICATGLSAGEMLAALRERLANDEEAERAVVREELLKITHVRLRKLLERP